jgi:uncharacterized protein YjbI with pentapeptide repeats
MSPQAKGALLLQYVAAKQPVVLWNEQAQRWDLLDFRNAELAGADLRAADLRWIDLAGADLQDARLDGADLTRANLLGARCARAHFTSARLGGADLQEADFCEARFEGARMEGANLKRADLRDARLDRAHLGGAHLDRALMHGARLKEASLERASISEADLRRADLRRCRLEGASLSSSDLRGANLSEGKLRGARLRGARCDEALLRTADLRDANLQEVDFTGADLDGVDFQGCLYNERTVWPDGWSPPDNGYALVPDAYLQAADLEGADLSGVDLSRVNLEGANLTGADLSGANLSGAELVHAALTRANLSGANLEGANLAGANMTWAVLKMANMHWTNLSRVNLEHAQLEGAYLAGADLVGAALEGANMEGANLHEAYLNESDLRGVNLQLANMEGAHIRGANLWEADLRGARVRNTSGFPEDLEDCKISSLTFSESGWSLSDFLRWYQAGVDITDLENFPAGVQEWFRDNREGLTLYFHTHLDRFAEHLLNGVILGLFGFDTEVEIQSFERLDNHTLVRIHSRRQAELTAVAELLHRRPWQGAADAEGRSLVRQLQEVLQGNLLQRLSVLLDQGDRVELWGFKDGELVKARTWPHYSDPRKALRNLLRDLFSDDELRQFLELRGEDDEGVPGADEDAELAAEVVRILEARELLDQPFFLQLREERPSRRKDILYVAGLWQIDASEDVLLGEDFE